MKRRQDYEEDEKIFAVLLTLAMVLAMSMTAFAAEFGTKTNDTASLTVSGLVPGEATEVSVYKVVGWMKQQVHGHLNRM